MPDRSLSGRPPSGRRSASLGARLLSLHTLDSFQFPAYRYYWTASLLSASGQMLQLVVIGWLTYDVTGSALLTAVAVGLSGIPNFLAVPLGGLLADRWDRVRLIVLSDAFRAIVTAIFAAVVVAGGAEAWHIFAYVLVQGFTNSISIPARMSLVPRIVPRQHLTNAFSLSLLTFSVASLAVPAAVGLLIALVGPGPTLFAGVALYLAAAGVVAAIHLNQADRPQRRQSSFIGEIVEGARYVGGQSVLLPLILLSAAAYGLITPAVRGLMPVFAAEVFEVGSVGLGLMMSALGVGSTVGTLVLASLGDVRYKGRIMLSCLGLTVVATLAFSLSPTIAVALPLIMLVGGGYESFAAMRSAAIQTIAPDRLRGRAIAVNFMGTGLSPLGGLLFGGVAEVLGAPAATSLAAFVMGACIAAGLSWRFRAVWGYQAALSLSAERPSPAKDDEWPCR